MCLWWNCAPLNCAPLNCAPCTAMPMHPSIEGHGYMGIPIRWFFPLYNRTWSSRHATHSRWCSCISSAHQEQELQSIDNWWYAQHWLPVLSKNVQANLSFEINVWVIHLHFCNQTFSPMPAMYNTPAFWWYIPWFCKAPLGHRGDTLLGCWSRTKTCHAWITRENVNME